MDEWYALALTIYRQLQYFSIMVIIIEKYCSCLYIVSLLQNVILKALTK